MNKKKIMSACTAVMLMGVIVGTTTAFAKETKKPIFANQSDNTVNYAEEIDGNNLPAYSSFMTKEEYAKKENEMRAPKMYTDSETKELVEQVEKGMDDNQFLKLDWGTIGDEPTLSFIGIDGKETVLDSKTTVYISKEARSDFEALQQLQQLQICPQTAQRE